MAYHLLDIFEVRTGEDQVRAERMSQVMIMEILEACELTYPAPGLVEAFERCAVEVAEYTLCILYFDPLAMAHIRKMVAPVKQSLPRSRHDVLCTFFLVPGAVESDEAFVLEIEIDIFPGEL